MKAMEMHYTAQELAVLMRKCDRFVRDEIKAGAFGPDVFFVGGDYLVAASAANAYMERHRLPAPPAVQMGVPARSEGELRRKLAAAA